MGRSVHYWVYLCSRIGGSAFLFAHTRTRGELGDHPGRRADDSGAGGARRRRAAQPRTGRTRRSGAPGTIRRPSGASNPPGSAAGGSCARHGARRQGHRSLDQHRVRFSFTNLRGRVAQAKMPGVTVPASVMSPARGSTNRCQMRVARSCSVEVKQVASPVRPLHRCFL